MGLDLDAYFARVGFAGAAKPDLATLSAIHLGHASRIPFENLDVQMGLPISLELEALEDKLVRRRRGGYCFEHNTLLLAVLHAIGFDAEPFEARVRLGATEIRPRTHMLLHVRVAGGDDLVDVGFGGEGLLAPVPMDGLPHDQFGMSCRVVEQDGLRVLQWRAPQGWTDLYAFVPEARPAIDFVMANHFTSTHPSSGFVQTLTAQLPTPEARYMLRNLSYTITRGAAIEARTLAMHELGPLLRERFGIELEAGARLRALEPPVS